MSNKVDGPVTNGNGTVLKSFLAVVTAIAGFALVQVWNQHGDIEALKKDVQYLQIACGEKIATGKRQ